MSVTAKTFPAALVIGLVACGTTALLVTATRRNAEARSAQAIAQSRTASRKRNLLLQPEAFKLARKLGSRFLADETKTSVVSGTLTIGADERTMQLARKQTEDGESVEIQITGWPTPLTWDSKQGGVASGRSATGSDRVLIERLVFDSPDQFVLMQFRGASYYKVARAVRPIGATDDYNGPLWTIVRVDDPEQDEAKRPGSRWRLYYLNTTTGLIDRIESEIEGKRIVAEISSWTEQNGEKVPARIVWMRDGQTLMQYRLTNFSQSQN
jgi:hypothetical protein